MTVKVGTEVDAAKAWLCTNGILDSQESEINRTNAAGRFLEHVVDVTLQGQRRGVVIVLNGETAEKLRGQKIAEHFYAPKTAEELQDALNRVRETAARLRGRLQRYYNGGNGNKDPYRIELPAGSYVPVFVLRRRWPNMRLAGLVLSILFFAFLIWALNRPHAASPPAPPPATKVDGFHYLDIEHAAPMAEIRYGTVVRGRAQSGTKDLYLSVLDEAGAFYWPQADHNGGYPLTPCADGSWARQVWPGTADRGNESVFTLTVVMFATQLDKPFKKTELPSGVKILKQLQAKRTPPLMMKTYLAACPPE